MTQMMNSYHAVFHLILYLILIRWIMSSFTSNRQGSFWVNPLSFNVIFENIYESQNYSLF